MVGRATKLGLSLVFWAGYQVWQRFRQLLGTQASGTCMVLCYHGVRDEHRDRFARQMDDLVHWAKPISADASGPLESGVHHVAVTFDDGLASILENALPELSRRRIPSTLFVPTGYLGRQCTWMRVGQVKLCRRDREQLLYDVVMSPAQLACVENDLVSIGSHTVTHCNLAGLEETEAKQELGESKRQLERLVGRNIELLSLPRGDSNANVLRWAREAGYQRVFTSVPAFARARPDEYVTGRIAVEPTDWRLEFRLKALGGYCWLPVASSLKRRIRALSRVQS